jgi:hypothetical protein
LWRIDRSLRVAFAITSTLAVVVPVLRFLAIDSGMPEHRWYNHFGYRCDALLVGCALAIWLRNHGVPQWVSESRLGALAAVCP